MHGSFRLTAGDPTGAPIAEVIVSGVATLMIRAGTVITTADGVGRIMTMVMEKVVAVMAVGAGTGVVGGVMLLRALKGLTMLKKVMGVTVIGIMMMMRGMIRIMTNIIINMKKSDLFNVWPDEMKKRVFR